VIVPDPSNCWPSDKGRRVVQQVVHRTGRLARDRRDRRLRRVDGHALRGIVVLGDGVVVPSPWYVAFHW